MEREVEVDEDVSRFVERMGLLVEEDGWPRIAGRILGFLMVTPGDCSLDDIASALGVSRASVSTDARRLTQAGMLERRSRPGDRRDYYRIAPESVRSSLRSRIGRLRQYHDLIDGAVGAGVGGSEVRARLAGWSEGHGLVLAAMEGALAELDRRAASAPPSAT